MRLQNLAQRPERDPLPVGQAASLAPADELRALVYVAEQLGAQPALATARLADERDQCNRAIARAAIKQALQQRLLHLTPDEQRVARADQVGAETSQRLDRAVQTDGLALSLDLDRRQRLIHKYSLRLPERLLRDGNAADGRHGLDPSCGIHHVSRNHPFPLLWPRSQRHHRLTRRDTNPHLQPQIRLTLVQLNNRLENPQPCADRPLGIVLVGNRSPEHRHHRITDELLDRPPIALELVPEGFVIRAEPSPHILGIDSLRRCGEADEIAEQNGHDLALLIGRPRSRGSECQPALATELRPAQIRGSTARTQHEPQPRAETSSTSRNRSSAPWTRMVSFGEYSRGYQEKPWPPVRRRTAQPSPLVPSSPHLRPLHTRDAHR